MSVVDRVDPGTDSARDPITEAAARIAKNVSSLLPWSEHTVTHRNIAFKFPLMIKEPLHCSSHILRILRPLLMFEKKSFMPRPKLGCMLPLLNAMLHTFRQPDVIISEFVKLDKNLNPKD